MQISSLSYFMMDFHDGDNPHRFLVYLDFKFPESWRFNRFMEYFTPFSETCHNAGD